jgi:hypothetical protein
MDESIGIGSRIRHPQFGEGILSRITLGSYFISFFNLGVKEIKRDYAELELIEAVEPEQDALSFSDVEKTLGRLLQRWADIQEVVPMGAKWEGGMMLLQPADKSIKPKEIPMETFFHKIVMLRDRLRVLEQNINSHKLLSDEDKINMQQYITRIYGTLTTFNVLFKDSRHNFVGEKGKE